MSFRGGADATCRRSPNSYSRSIRPHGGVSIAGLTNLLAEVVFASNSRSSLRPCLLRSAQRINVDAYKHAGWFSPLHQSRGRAEHAHRSLPPTGYSYQYRPIFSFLGGGGIRYYREQALFTTIGLRGLFSSGDRDYTSFIEGNSAGSATAFVPITSPVFGLVFSPQLGNLFLFELNYSIKPFSRRDSTDLQTQLKVMTFFRPSTGVRSEGWIDPASNSLYLGTEVDGAVNFRPLSDLGLSLSMGVFIPGSASFADTPVAFSGLFELSFSF